MENNKEVIQAIKEYCFKHPGAYEAGPFNEYPICFKVMGKIFAQFNPVEKCYSITLKCEPDKTGLYRQNYPDRIVGGYHCPPVQQPYWNTVNLDIFSDMELLYQMIDEAYLAVICKFNKKEKAELGNLSKLEFKDTNGEDQDFALLCTKLDEALNELVGGLIQRSQYEQYNKRDSIHDVIVVYENGEPVGCGAFKMYDPDHAELKRIYVEPFYRNTGLGAELVRRLEARAKIKGYQWCMLETGKPMEAACHMYKKLGYKVMPNYGQYADMPDSICMERKI